VAAPAAFAERYVARRPLGFCAERALRVHANAAIVAPMQQASASLLSLALLALGGLLLRPAR
jgi:hypothetical protein